MGILSNLCEICASLSYDSQESEAQILPTIGEKYVTSPHLVFNWFSINCCVRKLSRNFKFASNHNEHTLRVCVFVVVRVYRGVAVTLPERNVERARQGIRAIAKRPGKSRDFAAPRGGRGERRKFRRDDVTLSLSARQTPPSTPRSLRLRRRPGPFRVPLPAARFVAAGDPATSDDFLFLSHRSHVFVLVPSDCSTFSLLYNEIRSDVSKGVCA